jgi:hypothetical protein
MVVCFLTLPPFEHAFDPLTIQGSVFPNRTSFRVHFRALDHPR